MADGAIFYPQDALSYRCYHSTDEDVLRPTSTWEATEGDIPWRPGEACATSICFHFRQDLIPLTDILNIVSSAPRSALPDPSDPSYASLSTRYDTHQEARILLRYVFPREHKLEHVWTLPKREDRFVKAVLPEYRDWSNREMELLVSDSPCSHTAESLTLMISFAARWTKSRDDAETPETECHCGYGGTARATS